MFNKYILGSGIVALSLALSACNGESSQRAGERAQENVMQNASRAIPVPQVTQYPTRATIARWIDSANNPDQTHYIYIMLPGVGYVGYYVADSAPVNICTSMTPPKRAESYNGNPYVLPSPALDGVYYGGGCEMWYFFDVETGAKIEVGGQMAFFTSTTPLVIDAPRLRVETAGAN